MQRVALCFFFYATICIIYIYIDDDRVYTFDLGWHFGMATAFARAILGDFRFDVVIAGTRTSLFQITYSGKRVGGGEGCLLAML